MSEGCPKLAGNVLTARQRKAVSALLAGATVAAAAEQAGVDPRTVTRWRESEAFRSALAEGQAEMLASATRALAMIARAAVGVLGKVLVDSEARPADKLRAAAIVLERVLPLAELTDHEARISALEGANDPQS